MSKSALTIQEERAWSYATCLRDVTPEGRVVINQTRYSTTSSRHLSQVVSRLGTPPDTLYLGQVPRGTYSLLALADQECPRQEEAAGGGYIYDPDDVEDEDDNCRVGSAGDGYRRSGSAVR
jgi:hypothetical protein